MALDEFHLIGRLSLAEVGAEAAQKRIAAAATLMMGYEGSDGPSASLDDQLHQIEAAKRSLKSVARNLEIVELAIKGEMSQS